MNIITYIELFSFSDVGRSLPVSILLQYRTMNVEIKLLGEKASKIRLSFFLYAWTECHYQLCQYKASSVRLKKRRKWERREKKKEK